MSFGLGIALATSTGRQERWESPGVAMRRIVSALLLLAASSSVAADFAAGVEAYERGDYATALREFRPLAEQGDAAAQFNLGLMYANGEGVPEDDIQAVFWWRQAAEQGDADAQLNLGVMYSLGEGAFPRTTFKPTLGSISPRHKDPKGRNGPGPSSVKSVKV